MFVSYYRSHLSSRYGRLFGVLLLLTTVAGAAQSDKTTPKLMKGADVLATVEGQPITRRELTYFWLQTDGRAAPLLGNLLADKWKAARGTTPTYTVSESDIYASLFSADSETLYANVLSSLVTNRLVAIEAARKGIIVTRTQAQARAHEVLDQIRKSRNLQDSDDKLMAMYRIPKDIFLDDMLYHVRIEKLIAANLAKKNGHPISADDWFTVRELSAMANRSSNSGDVEAQFAEAKQRVERWKAEVTGGKSLEEVAREHNESETNVTGGLRGPYIRGTGTKSLEDAIFALKRGELTAPLRGRTGYYVFRLEKRGAEIPEADRTLRWKQVVEEATQEYLADLRRNAKITSVVPLPVNPPVRPSASILGDSMDLPPFPPRR